MPMIYDNKRYKNINHTNTTYITDIFYLLLQKFGRKTSLNNVLCLK